MFKYKNNKFIEKLKDEDNRNIVKNIIGAFVVKGGSMIVSLFTMPAYMRYFQNQTVLGLWFTILSVLNWVLMFDLGLGNGLRNKLPIAIAEKDENKAQQYVSSTYISTTFFIFILCLFSYMVFPYIPWNIFFNVNSGFISQDTLVTSVRIVFTGIMIQFLLKLITSILYAIQKSAIVNLLSLLSNVIILVSVLLAPPMNLEQSLITMSWINVIAVNGPLLITTILIFSTTLKKYKPSIKKYSQKYAMEILKIGGVLLWLQVVFMIISSTNEFLIAHLTTPSAVVEYQAYFKIFNAISSLFVLALVPIWSAVTKAQANNNYSWIKKLNYLLLLMAGVTFIVELAVVPFLQLLINYWLGESAIDVNRVYAIIFAISSSIFVLHNVNTSIGNGCSYFKTQIIWMTFAAIVNIPLAILFVRLTRGWIGVVLANILALLPFEILEPIYFNKYINTQIKKSKCNGQKHLTY